MIQRDRDTGVFAPDVRHTSGPDHIKLSEDASLYAGPNHEAFVGHPLGNVEFLLDGQIEGWRRLKRIIPGQPPEYFWIPSEGGSPTAVFPETESKEKDRSLLGRDILSALHFSRLQIEVLFQGADLMRSRVELKRIGRELEGVRLAIITSPMNTVMSASFAKAANWLGCRHEINISDKEKKGVFIQGGRSFDRLRLLIQQTEGADIIVLSLPENDAAQFAAFISDVPVINSWSERESPPHAIQDLYTISRVLGKIDGLHLVVAGDARRAEATSLSLLLSSVCKDVRITYLGDPLNAPSYETFQSLSRSGVRYAETATWEELSDADVLYISDSGTTSSGGLKETRYNFFYRGLSGRRTIMMEPLTENSQFPEDTEAGDYTIRSMQQRNTLYTQMAILAAIMGKT